MASTVDTIRALFTYLIAALIIVGGGVILFLTRTEAASADLRVLVAGMMGAAITFVFQQEGHTRASRASVTAHREGATLHANGLTGTPVAGEARSNGSTA